MATREYPRELAPKIVNYKYTSDLATLKDWFYNFDKSDNRQRAVDRVKSFQSRGKLPHGVECTALFTSLILSDPTTSTKSVKQYDSNVLQLSYSMALIRFVNGLLDPFQQGSYAISLHHLARNLGLPSFFVEIRHMGTHEQLPNLDILRIATGRAINWLYDHYWTAIDDIITGDGKLEVSGEKKDVNVVSLIEANLKTYKRIRKMDLEKIYDNNDTSEQGLRYWKAIRNLKHLLTKSDELSRILLMKNFLIYNNDKLAQEESGKKFKFNGLLIKLYKPLLDEIGPKFKVKLLHVFLDYVNDFNDKSAGFVHENELLQAQEWIKYLITDVLLLSEYDFNYEDTSIVTTKDELYALLISIVSQYSASQQRKSFSVIESQIDNDVSSDIVTKIDQLKKQAKLDSFAKVPSLDDILGLEPTKRPLESLESAPKRLKKESKGFLFEEHEMWEPLPFGVCQ